MNKKLSRAVSFSAPAAGLLFILIFASTASAQILPQTSALTTSVPHITGIYPASGPIGTQVTITGTNLSESDAISFGPGLILPDMNPAPSATQLTFTIPPVLILQCAFSDSPCSQTSLIPSPAVYTVRVATDYTLTSPSNSVSFTVTPTTVVTSIAPSQGTIGTQVTIYGYGFSTSANAINFDTGSLQGIIPQIGNSSSEIEFTIPQYLFPRCVIIYPPCSPTTYTPSPGTYSMSVAPGFNFSQISNSFPFTLLSGSAAPTAPVITSITPASGTIGTQVTVKGYGFSPNLDVIDFGTGLALPKFVGNDLVFSIPNSLVPRCTFFSNPPCPTTTTVPMVPGTYDISVAINASTVSNALPLTVTPIPFPTTLPAATSTLVTTEVTTITALHVRSDPSLSAPLVGTEASGSIGMVQAGPVAADGYDWFQIDWQDGLTGWSVGNYFTASFPSLCPVTIGDSVYTFVIGEQNALTLYVRSNPSLTATISGAETAGTKGTVTGGPVVADGYEWWTLRFPDGTSGWVAQTNFVDVNCVSVPTSTVALPPSPQSPAVSFVTPQSGATISGQVPLTVSASSSFAITGVSFYANDTLIGTATNPPYTVTWDTTRVLTGSYTLKAILNTAAGISAQSSITVTVTGGIAPPVVNFITPQAGATVSGQVPVTVSVSSSLPVSEVDFYSDGAPIGKATSAPYTVTWDATQVYNGYHTLYTVAYTTQAGLTGNKAIGVYVTGGLVSPTSTQPSIEVSFTAPQTGATVSGDVPVGVSVSSSVPISEVDFYADGGYFGAASSVPYTVTWNATKVSNGWHTIYALAKATNGYTGSRSLSVNVTGGYSSPVVNFVTPQAGATVSGQVPVTVSVSSSLPAVTEVDFYDGGALIGKSAAAPYTAIWNAAQAYNGINTLIAVARTTETNISGSKSVVVNVTGGLPPPATSVSITAPQDGATVFGKVPITAAVSSTVAVSEVDLYENGALLGVVQTAPYALTWDATQAAPGNYSITATAKAAGASASQSISVNVIAPPVFSVGERVVVQTDSRVGLNVRSGPSINYSIIGTEPNGSLGTILNSIPIIADTYNWWQVKYDDGVTGWSVEAYLAAAP
jgi:uncharacterized protein YgiM (DUF1202 family)